MIVNNNNSPNSFREDKKNSAASGIYRFVLAFNKKQLFFLSFFMVMGIATIFFIGFLIGHTYFTANPKQKNALGLAKEDVVSAEQARGIGETISLDKNSGVTQKDIPNWLDQSVNQKSDFNTNDLVFENILLSEDSDLTVEGTQVLSQEEQKSATKTALSSQQRSENLPVRAPRVTKKKSVAKIEKLNSVTGLNTLPKEKASIYEGYPQEKVTYYYLQLMTSGSVGKGRRFSSQLRGEGFAVRLEEVLVKEEVYYVILIGLYKDKNQAVKHLRRFQTASRYGEAFTDAFLRPYQLTKSEEVADVGDVSVSF